MMGWVNRSVHCTGSVFFRGTMAPRLEELEGLAPAGVRVVKRGKDPRVHWAAEVEHDRWGKATVVCRRDATAPPKQLFDHDVWLSDAEREAAKAGQSPVTVIVKGEKGNVLRDRKRLLGFLRAVMGGDGAVAMDHLSTRNWSRAALDDELAHDADVDIEALYCLHAIVPDGGERCYWLHSHGLSHIGFFDFDILNPAEELLRVQTDALRALAFAIVEGGVKPGTTSFPLAQPGGNVRLVDVAEFNRRADAATKALRDVDESDEDHNKDRAVLCEPAGGFLGRFFDKLKPNRWLCGPMPEEAILHFSTAAGELMAERARATYGRFREFAEEFAEFEFPIIAKLGYVVDGGGPDDKEHLWFSVDRAHDDRLDATLQSQPFNIARMQAGQHGSHPLELMTDWAIVTPAGMINPRNTRPARVVREHADEIRQALAAHRAGR
jgi:hypothetical protein